MSAATPISTITTRAPTWRANTLIAAPPRQEIEHHLRSHFLRIGADAFGYHAVVAGHYHHNLVRQVWQVACR